MHLDVRELRQFYYRTKIGRAAQRAVRDQVQAIWPRAEGQTVVGFGFAAPLMRPYLASARRVVALMPGPQGVMPWPAGDPNVSVLCSETLWPLETGSADKLIVLHGLETSEHPAALLEECYRVLAAGGTALFIVPHRGGLWARNDATPFGYGRPYTVSQLEAQLRRHGFEVQRHRAALFLPPSTRRFWVRTGQMWEQLGQKLSSGIAGGVLMLEVVKQVPAPPRPGLPEAVRRPLKVLDGIAKPPPKPAGAHRNRAPCRNLPQKT